MNKRQPAKPKPLLDYFSPEFLRGLQFQPESNERTLAILSYTILTGGRFEWEGKQLLARFDDDEEDECGL
jgi:hypothetical protein